MMGDFIFTYQMRMNGVSMLDLIIGEVLRVLLRMRSFLQAVLFIFLGMGIQILDREEILLAVHKGIIRKQYLWKCQGIMMKLFHFMKTLFQITPTLRRLQLQWVGYSHAIKKQLVISIASELTMNIWRMDQTIKILLRPLTILPPAVQLRQKCILKLLLSMRKLF